MEQQNLFNILGVERQELVHSRFISWLLNSNSSHGLGTKPLENFLKLLYKAIDKKVNTPSKDIYQTLLKKLSNKSNKISNVEVTNETDKIDITIKFIINGDDKTPIKILIENKVGAKETKSQTKVYYDKNKGHNVIFVYLTPLHSVRLERLNEPECECKQYIQINYQQLLDEVIEPASKHEFLKCVSNKYNKNKIFINEYIMNLSTPPSKKSKNNENIFNDIMAISIEELRKLWKEVKQEKVDFAKKLYAFATVSPELQEHMTVIEQIINEITSDSKEDFIVVYNKHLYCEKSAKDTLLKVVAQIIKNNGIEKVRKTNLNKIILEQRPTNRKQKSYPSIPETGLYLDADNRNNIKEQYLNNVAKELNLDLQVIFGGEEIN